MFKNFFRQFSKDVGLDLGSSHTRVYVKDKGIVVDEPSVVALNIKTDQIIAVGHTARDMVGKTPGHISTTRPLLRGIISDYEVAEKMIKFFIDKVHEDGVNLVLLLRRRLKLLKLNAKRLRMRHMRRVRARFM